MILLPLLLAASAPNPDLFLERQALLALDRRCDLLSPGARAALTAGARQAGAALERGGVPADEVSRLAGRAQGAAGELGCDLAQVRTAAAAAEDAFTAWAAQPRAEFPGRTQGWTATRRPGEDGWLLVQRAGGLELGLRQAGELPRLGVRAPDGAGGWSSAALFLRDAGRGGVLRANLSPLTAAPRAGAVAFLAEGREESGRGTVFGLPLEAVRRMAALNPEEAVEIELSPKGPGAPLRALFEVGDFAAALAFLEAGGLVLPDGAASQDRR